jgi:redox-sensitive bicupin YhaK (pirin superfamily)
MKTRSINQIYPAFKINMGGIFLDQALPNRELEQVDPFLLVHHLHHQYPAGSRQNEVGVPPHPHRGFAPVTFVFKGGVHHRDSRNNDSVIYEGGTQWMHAGRGITHSERPAKEIAESGASWELIQWWINLPAEHKMTDPQYIPLTQEDTPVYTSSDGLVTVGVVAGELHGVTGGIQPFTDVLALRMEMKAGGKIEIPIASSYNGFTYQLDGKLMINEDTDTKSKDLVHFANDGDGIIIEAVSDSRLILLAGEPINEPMVSHGPFVMNDTTEIMQAIRDYQMGKMGILIESFD